MEETFSDPISTQQAYKLYGIPRAGLRSLADQHLIKSMTKKVDVCHTMKYWCESDIKRWLANPKTNVRVAPAATSTCNDRPFKGGQDL